MLRELHFPQRYINWIMICLTTVCYTIQINGELTKPFEARKGLRQEDPISPYLFVICMEYRCLMTLHDYRKFHFHQRCKGIKLVHVCFADDLLLFTKGDLSSITQLLRMLEKFVATSGLKANQQKSCICFGGVKEEDQQETPRLSRMNVGQLPFKYLGVPLSSQKLSAVQCQPLVQKITQRINCWSASLLTYAGRVQLIKSVLFGMQMYWSQIFILPLKVIKLVQSACRIFLWTGNAELSKRALVAWDKIMLPQSAGGMGIINMKLWNRATICKMLWCLAQKKDRIWIKCVHEYYVKGAAVQEMEILKQSSWLIIKIIGSIEYLQTIYNGRQWLQESSFSIKKLYKAFEGNLQKQPWAKVICQNAAPPNIHLLCGF